MSLCLIFKNAPLILIKEENAFSVLSVGMNIIYREVEASDAVELLKYNSKVGGETDYLSFGADSFNISAESEARFINRFKSSAKNLMLVALDGDRIIANASVERNHIPRYSHRAELSITVLREYWGRGIGTAMMQRLIDFSRDSGAEIIYLDVRADNERAKALYRKFGFESVGIFKNYFKIKNDRFDAEIMTLLLQNDEKEK